MNTDKEQKEQTSEVMTEDEYREYICSVEAEAEMFFDRIFE